MAKFVAYYNLCPIQYTKEFLGISRDRDEGNIILTLGQNIIMVTKLSTQKQMHSWTVLDKLSSKVVYDRQNQQYIGVFGNRYIRCWTEDTTDINKLKKIKFYKNIADLVCTEKDVLLLYNDGSCETLSSGIESRTVQRNETLINESQLQSIVDANVFVYPDGRRLLVYFNINNKTSCTECITQILDEDTFKPIGKSIIYDLKRQDQNASLAGYTVFDGQSSPCLLTIWSDKRVFTMQLVEDSSPKNAPGTFISMLSVLNVDSPLSLVGISKNCVAIYGANSGQEGASLILYNTQFKVVNAQQFFKIYFDFSRLWSVENHILLAMGQNLSVVSVRMSKEMLSEIIGSQVSVQSQDYVGDDFINEEDELEESLCFATKAKKKNFQENSFYDIIGENEQNETNAEEKKIPFKNYDDFDKEIKQLCRKTLHVEFVEKEEEREFQIQFMANLNDSGFRTDAIEIISKELEKRGACEQEITEKILSILILADVPDDIAVCLRRYTNISEKMLAKMLNYALNDLTKVDITKQIESMEQEYDNNINVNVLEIEMSDKEYPIQDILVKKMTHVNVLRRSDLINLILSCSINFDTISSHIRKEVEFQCAMRLLNHLYNLINSREIELEERPETSLIFDDDIKILQWLGVVLNTHFQDIVLSRDTKVIDVLVKWIEMISLYKSDLKNLEELATILYSVVEKKLIANDNKYYKWYSIEEVKLY